MNSKIISTGLFDSDLDPADETSAEPEIHRFSVEAALHHLRLDRCLAVLAPGFSRSYLQTLIAQGDVRLNDQVATKPSQKVVAGAVLQVYLRPTPASTCFQPEALPLTVVHEDPYLLVIDKPAGWVVHPAPGNWSGTVLNAMLHHCPEAGHLPRAGIVHRLDKHTSGLMVIAKTRPVMDALVKLIAARQVNRFYLAVAGQAWPKNDALIVVRQAVGRDPHQRLRMAVLPEQHVGAKSAMTAVRRVSHSHGAVLVACKLFTGRTHQIRVHLSWLGLPLVADAVYGGRSSPAIDRQALHAACLQFVHPVTEEFLKFTAPIPPDMNACMAQEGLQMPVDSASPDWFSTLDFGETGAQGDNR